MKKIVSTFLLMSMFTLVPSMPTALAATEPSEGIIDMFEAATFEFGEAIAPCPAGTFRVRRSTRTKKKLLNAALATGIGAAIGGGVGGGRGALLGAGTGAGGYLTYRYIRDRRGRCVRSYRRY
ncbi:MAG: hypothetical protein ABR530_09355 [Pyrinomonadaceae bacterium]